MVDRATMTGRRQEAFRAGRLVWVLPILAASSCVDWWADEPVSSAADYVAAGVEELRKGHFDQAEDLLARARGRAPLDELALRWQAELNLMRWRDDAALDLLVELTRVKPLRTVTESELRGQIGDLLFRLGRFGESATYLRSDQSSGVDSPRRSKAFVTLGLPYTRRDVEFKPTDIRLFEGLWPAMLCRFGQKERVLCLGHRLHDVRDGPFLGSGCGHLRYLSVRRSQ